MITVQVEVSTECGTFGAHFSLERERITRHAQTHTRIAIVFISQNFSTTLFLTSFHHRLVGRGPTGVTLLEVVILFTEFFRNVCGSDSVAVPSTFFVRAVVGFM